MFCADCNVTIDILPIVKSHAGLHERSRAVSISAHTNTHLEVHTFIYTCVYLQ